MRLIFSAVVIVTILGAFIAFEHFYTDPSVDTALNGKLSPPQAKAIDLEIDLSKLFITWVLALAGAAAFFLKMNLEKGTVLSWLDVLLTFAILALCVLSLYFGHLAIDKSAQALSLDQFPLHDPVVRRNLRGQYLSALSAIGLFGFHVFQFFSRRVGSVEGSQEISCG